MSNDIKVGDLVMCVTGCPNCGHQTGIGIIFKVNGIIDDSGDWTCFACDENLPGPYAHEHGYFDCVPVSRLRKIDPPSEGETREAYVNLKQPRKVTA